MCFHRQTLENPVNNFFRFKDIHLQISTLVTESLYNEFISLTNLIGTCNAPFFQLLHQLGNSRNWLGENRHQNHYLDLRLRVQLDTIGKFLEPHYIQSQVFSQFSIMCKIMLLQDCSQRSGSLREEESFFACLTE